MPTNIRQAFVSGTGTPVDTVTSVALADTRIRGVYSTGIGQFIINGTETDENNNVKGNIIKYVQTTAIDANYLTFDEIGIRVVGIVSVICPAGGTAAIFYG
tara:strand:- start:50 stop:352 length:303 start_codon:yes stop_codon:yes gene_type:complete